MNTVTEVKPVSKYAAKKAQKAAELAKQAETPEIVKVTVVEPAAMQVAAQEQLPELFGDMFKTVMGDDAEDLLKVEELRSEGYALMQKSKSFNLKDASLSTNKRVWLLERKTLFELKDMAYGDFHDRYAKLVAWPTLKAAFDKKANAWKNDPTSEEGSAFQAMLLQAMANYPTDRYAKAHEANLAEATQLKADFAKLVEDQELTYLMGVDCFDRANDIAEKHGWAKTSAKGGDNK